MGINPLKRFSLVVTVRVLLLLATAVGWALILGRADLFFNQVILSILILLQTVGLIRYVRRTNYDLAKFLLAIRHADYTVHFGQEKDNSFGALHHAFREIQTTYQRMNAEREAQYQYLNLLVSHLNVGIISLRGDDDIVLINPPALELLQIDTYHHWHNLARQHPRLGQVIDALRDGERQLLELPVGGMTRRLTVQVRSAVLLREPYRIVTLQDIEQEINQSEVEAYHKLIRILTHEIMNSITPIASLSETLLGMLHDEDGQLRPWESLGEAYQHELAHALRTIGRRSDGLLHFVEDYRRLTKLPALRPERVAVAEVLAAVGQLMRAELKPRGIAWQQRVDPDDLTLWGDARLIEQVLINLVTNSGQALEATANPQIMLRAFAQDERTVVEVADNGAGVPPDKLDQVFVPFFSTKARGSGIGLSLSRHIMTLHRGSIHLHSEPGEQTVVSLSFPARAPSEHPAVSHSLTDYSNKA